MANLIRLEDLFLNLELSDNQSSSLKNGRDVIENFCKDCIESKKGCKIKGNILKNNGKVNEKTNEYLILYNIISDEDNLVVKYLTVCSRYTHKNTLPLASGDNPYNPISGMFKMLEIAEREISR